MWSRQYLTHIHFFFVDSESCRSCEKKSYMNGIQALMDTMMSSHSLVTAFEWPMKEWARTWEVMSQTYNIYTGKKKTNISRLQVYIVNSYLYRSCFNSNEQTVMFSKENSTTERNGNLLDSLCILRVSHDAPLWCTFPDAPDNGDLGNAGVDAYKFLTPSVHNIDWWCGIH